MTSDALQECLNEKIQAGEFETSDIPAYLTLFCQMGDGNEELQDEVEGWNRRIQLVMAGLGTYWITVKDGRFETGIGAVEKLDLTLTLTAVDAAQIFAGEIDAEATFMSGNLKIMGDLPDAVKLLTLIEIVAEGIDY